MRLTQAELAEQLGYSRNYVTLMETGAKPVTDEVAYKLTQMLTAPAPPDLREQPAPYPAPATAVCRLPADCDLPAQLTEIRAEMADMRGKLDTLLGLLGGPLRRAAGIDDQPPVDRHAG